MKSVDDLIFALRDKGIKLRVEAGNLAIDAPKGALNAQMVEELRAHKASIITLLRGNDTAKAVRIPRRMVDAQQLLSFAQQRLWFIAQLEGASEAYHIPGAVRLQGDLDQAALQQALDTMVERHEVLRTSFIQAQGSAVQVIDEEGKFALEVVDLSQFPPADREAAVQRHVIEEACAPFDLSVGPLIRGRLLRVAEQAHVFLITMHHIVSDGWSLGIFIREVGVLYSAYREGRPNPLAALPIQYADYAVWQRQWLVGDRLQTQLTYWQQQLSGAPALLELPTDRPRPAVQSYAGGSVEFALGETLCRQLKAFSRHHEVTLFMALYSSFAILLSRLSGQDDIVIGTAMANRQRTEVEGLIGFFVNTLALRVRLSDTLTVRELLNEVREMTLVGYSHQEAPFEQVVEVVQPPRSLSHSPIFQVMFTLQNAPQSEAKLPGLSLAPQAMPQTTAQYDLSLSLQEMGDEMVGSFNYASDLFDRETIERWSDYFKAVLTEMLRDAEQTMGVIPLLGEGERRQLIEEFNATQVTYPQDTLIHELFEAQVKRTPQSIAVVYEAEQLTYEELNLKANQLAHYLRDRGVTPDSLVGICVERSVEMVVGILGILKAGGAYVPLDPSYPQERLAYMLKDAAPRVVLIQARLKESLPATSAELISLDSEWSEIARHDSSDLDPAAVHLTPKHLAYVIYTSGSTGKPKGVLVEHRSAINLVCDWVRRTNVDRCEVPLRASVWTSFSFDVSVFELFAPLALGGEIHIAPEVTRWHSVEWFNWLVNQQISHTYCPPFFVRNFAEMPREALAKLSLQRMLVGVEPINEANLYKLRTSVPLLTIVNGYGPTETTIFSTSYVDIRDVERSVPIGRPISNTQIYILDGHGQPVPMGVNGELYIGGVGVARGYLNRPELTAERFLKDPFSEEPNARMYKTGDVGRWRADGNIEYVGRNDHQVKIRGFRIELGEIESQLRRYPHVKEAVVLAREDRPGEKRLVAYLTSGEDALSVEALRSHLKGSLPEYMIPSAFVQLAQLPLTPNGKLDRHALPAPELEAYAVQAYEAPQGEREQALASIWQNLLQVERVGRHDNFFELGGHSLLIVQLIEQLRQVGLSTELRTVFTSPTLMALASTLKCDAAATFIAPPNLIPAGCTVITPEMLTLVQLSAEEIEHIVQTVPGGAANVQDIYPLVPLQEGILFHHLLNKHSDPYVLPMLLAVESRAKLDALLNALQAVIDRHDILRTAVLWRGLPKPVQVVYRQASLSVQEIELDAAQDVLEQLKARMAPERLWMDLQQAPLIRVQIARDVHSSRWYVLLQQHHIISDHVGQEIILSEVLAQLAGEVEGLSEPVAYRGFVAQAMAYAERNDAESYFRAKLGTLEEPTAPFGLLDVHGDGSGIVEAHQEMEGGLARRVRACARQLRVSAATLFHAAWALVMAKTSGRDDVVFGSVLSGRLQGTVGADRVLGMFINTLPLRSQLKGMSVQQLVEHTQQELAELLKYEQASLALAQRCSGISGGTALFSAVLNYRHSAPNTPSAGEVNGHPFGIQLLAGQERTNYPLTLSVDDLGVDFAITAQVDQRLEASRMTAYVHEAMESLIQALESAPEAGVLTLGVLPQAERQQLLEGFNATQVTYPQDTLIHELFEAQVKQTPQSIAVVYEAEQLTYEELNRKANQLAHYLRDRGVTPDSLVGICVERSVEMVVGILGILKAGGAYVPLDPSYPQERLEYMLKDAAPRVVLIQARLKESLPATSAELISLDSEWSEIARHDSSDLDPAAVHLTSKHLAYVIYTSGSTGQPKGVMNEHRAVINRLHWMQEQYRLDQSDRVLQKTPFSFDVSVWEFFWPLLNGVCLIVARPQGHQDPEYLSDLIHTMGITVVHFVPSMLQVFLEQGTMAQCKTLRHAVCSGEELSVALQSRCLDCLPQAQLHNLYGPTEAAIDVTYWECDRDAELSRVPIGRPINNTQIYILDGHGQPVPMGVNGELYIGGVGVARGYLNRPELTAERFLKDPFSEDANARMYKTGDVGRWRADGNIEYVGRNDHQVKIRGFRIELGEIESQLRRYPHVKEAVVLAREDRPGEKRLVAYLTHSEEAPSVEALRSHLKGSLPEYMIPSAFVQLAQLPLTPNGKLDRAALPAPELEAYAVQAYEAPQGEIEEALARIWQDLLQVERVGRHDNFFELGGHSLLAMQLLGRIRTVLKIEVPLRTLFEYPILHNLQTQLATQTLVTLMPMIRADRNQALPLSWSQQRLWFIAQLEGASEAYHIPGAVRLQGDLDQAALQQALDTMVERHEVLRTSFIQAQGSAVQVIDEEGKFALEVIDLSQFPPAECEAAIQRHTIEEACAPFDLSVGPLIRGRLLRVAEQAHVFLITMHHIVSDGWSLGIFIREVGVLYSAYREGRPNPLAALPIQYADYAVWQRQWLIGDRLQTQLTYWQQQLSGAPALLELPTDRPRPAVQSYAGGSVEFALGETLCRQLKAFSRHHEVTLFMALYSSFAILLSRLSGQDDIVIGTAMANRQRTEVEGLIGFFVNTLALRVRLSDTLTVRELLNEVREMTLVGYSHQEAPFEQVVEVVQPPRSLSHSPIFQVMFTLQNAPQSEAKLPGLSLAPQAMPQTTAQYDLSLSLQEIGDEMVGSFNYASDLFDRETIERWSDYFKAVLTEMLRDAEQTMGVIPLLGENERRQLIEEFNATQVAYPQDTLIHELFEAQVKRTPQSIAVVYEAEQLTYEALNLKANQLAHYLRDRGVTPDSLVGICVERSVEMVVGILGILKAGGAYVPLDPSYPQERLEYMLKDAAPKIVLTQERLKIILPQTSANVIAMDSEWAEIGKSAGENLSRDGLTSNHLTYVIYTSGSTGQPKGVMIEHRGLNNYLQWAVQAYAPETGEGAIVTSSLSFDATITSLYTPLLRGRAVVLIRDGEEVEGLEALLQEQKKWSLIKISPAHLSVLGLRLQAQQRSCSIGAVVIGGEALPATTVALWQSIVPKVRLINEYGPTETVVGCSVFDIPPQWNIDRSVPIGRPISNTQIYILDGHRQPVPMGVNGEIYIGGAGVARGYLNRPELTAERFIQDPYSEDPSARMYKTGDVGRWRADGNIEYVGRNDHQVKIRGFRIELGEIESQLTRYPQVKEAVVVAREDRPGDKRLVAYLTRSEEALNIKALRMYLKGALPEYMIPSAFVLLSALPLTLNGKVDRKALPEPEGSAYQRGEYEAPHGAIEETIAEIWQTLLKVERVSRHDNFFELGGHSLLMLELISRLQNCGLNATLQVVFEYPTIKMLGAYLEDGADIQSTNDNLITLKRGGSSRPLFLIHPSGGSVLPYVPLARLLHDSIPVHALQMTEINNSVSIQQFATKYLEIIQRTQSHGPYRLAGWSMGALIAYEMAYQLLKMGKSVEFVGLIDPAIHIARPQDTHQSNELSDVSILLSALEVFAPTIDQATLLELRGLDEVHLILDRCKQIGALPMALSPMDLQAKIQNHRALEDACATYSPKPLPIASHFFLAQNELPTHLSRDPVLFAGDKAQEIIIGGTHETIVNSPYVEQLADAINESLGEFEESQYSSGDKTPFQVRPLPIHLAPPSIGNL